MNLIYLQYIADCVQVIRYSCKPVAGFQVQHLLKQCKMCLVLSLFCLYYAEWQVWC